MSYQDDAIESIRNALCGSNRDHSTAVAIVKAIEDIIDHKLKESSGE